MSHQKNEIWDRLTADWSRLKDQHLRDLFATNPNRFDNFSYELDDLCIDFSKECIDPKVLENLIKLAQACDVEQQRDAMFAGQPINTTEGRAAMHIALRAKPEDGYHINGDVTADLVDSELEKFLKFADQLRDGTICNAAGQKFTDIVNIGIGGSDLGPYMASRALSEYATDGPHVHFVSNVDGAHLSDTLARLNPETTFFLIASKSFTTQETLANAKAAQRWVKNTVQEQANQHFAALSTNLSATSDFGIPETRVFGFWDWVGGRYSLTSSIGLSLAIDIGSENFRAMLAGFRDMDLHFKSAPLNKNLPVLLALIGIWRRNFMNCATVALIPYNQRLQRFASYVQQMDMESNGKSITKDNHTVSHATAPIIWGGSGTNVQHSFFQLVHQGTDIIPIDFMLCAKSGSDLKDQHDILTAHFLAQSDALAFGKTTETVTMEMIESGIDQKRALNLAPHRTFQGNRPSTSIIFRDLTPYSLGRLIALYEHKVFVQGVIWNINSFDQWGVELGKVLANRILPVIKDGAHDATLNSSTKGLIAKIKRL